MTPSRRARLIALGALHDRFAAAKIDGSPFRPSGRTEGSDYNIHYVDLESDDDTFHDAAREVLQVAR